MIPLAKPSITEQDIEAVVSVLRSCRLSCGPVVEQFEMELAKIAGVHHAICVNSGTSALDLIVKSLGIGAGDEVICPSFSFIASANCLVSNGATPVFVDIDPTTYCLDTKKIEADITNNTKAILAVDLFGRCANWTELERLAKQYDLLLIEDACEAIGAIHAGRPAGSFGDAACFSFYPNKQITTGEGGVVLTNNPSLANICRALRNQGRTSGRWLAHEMIGMNYRMTELQAALGLSQLRRWPNILVYHRQVAYAYLDNLQADNIIIPHYGDRSWFVYVVRLYDHYTRQDRDSIIDGMAEHGIECRAYFPPIHLQPVYREKFGYKEGLLPLTEAIADRTIALPFYPDMTVEDVKTVCMALHALLTTRGTHEALSAL